MIQHEKIKENGYSINRLHFTEGYIDSTMCDTINNPNNPTKSSIQLNSIKTYHRLNQNPWILLSSQQRAKLNQLSQFQSIATAQEVFNEVINT
jgi:hypothetical protein